jgi:putative methyltransferase (TIGR04325 family)
VEATLQQPRAIWEGVYKDLSEVPTAGPGFCGAKWLTACSEKTSQLLKLASENCSVPRTIADKSCLLPFLAAMLAEDAARLRILDFGGGLGSTYVSVASSLPTKNLDYVVVEGSEVCSAAKKIFAGDSRVRFVTAIPESLHGVDIVHLGSSLHYVAKWKEVLRCLAGLNSRYWLFTDLVAGDIPTYASAQNYYDSKIPVWFFNFREVTSEVESLGFKLVFKSIYLGTYLGKEGPIPQNNFPEHLRLDHSCNVLFSRCG